MKYRCPVNADDYFLTYEEEEELFRYCVPGDADHYFLTYEEEEELFRYWVPDDAEKYSAFLEDFLNEDIGYILDKIL